MEISAQTVKIKTWIRYEHLHDTELLDQSFLNLDNEDEVIEDTNCI